VGRPPPTGSRAGRADRALLLGPQLRLGEVAEVADADAIALKDEDDVRSELCARRGVMLAGDADHLANRGLRPARGTHHLRVVADRPDAVVVGVIVRYKHERRLDAHDWRVREAAPAGELGVVEWVDKHCGRVAEREGGVAVPADAHRA
jgi:hypothetical protein